MAERDGPSELSADRRHEYEEAFMLFDKDCDGLLHASDLSLLLRSLGQTIKDAEVTQILQQSGIDPRGKFTSLDFVNLMERRAHLGNVETFQTEQEVRDAFRMVLDPKGTGVASADDIMNLLQVFGDGGALSQQQIWEMLATADKMNTGKVNYEEFVKALTSD
jgi:Ca2+-binding EF-hand superfamily protein